ncbi:hypothetical protein F4780DRAFT_194561 [Xylariomycetidae sp. FL0641]|nr:hypothetical protein F4780DRAFT_194561 [Xylariomycetidae sp. FL0641]
MYDLPSSTQQCLGRPYRDKFDDIIPTITMPSLFSGQIDGYSWLAHSSSSSRVVARSWKQAKRRSRAPRRLATWDAGAYLPPQTYLTTATLTYIQQASPTPSQSTTHHTFRSLSLSLALPPSRLAPADPRPGSPGPDGHKDALGWMPYPAHRYEHAHPRLSTKVGIYLPTYLSLESIPPPPPPPSLPSALYIPYVHTYIHM